MNRIAFDFKINVSSDSSRHWPERKSVLFLKEDVQVHWIVNEKRRLTLSAQTRSENANLELALRVCCHNLIDIKFQWTVESPVKYSIAPYDCVWHKRHEPVGFRLRLLGCALSYSWRYKLRSCRGWNRTARYFFSSQIFNVMQIHGQKIIQICSKAHNGETSAKSTNAE